MQPRSSRADHAAASRACAAWQLVVPLAGCLLTCGGAGGARGSALLITLDTTRADALSCYGNPEATTPALDTLAAEGVVFDAAHTVAPLTLPAHASMLTGLYPLRHGLRGNGENALAAAAETIAERARAAGFDTAAFVSSVTLHDGFGLGQGFDVYSAPDLRGPARRAHEPERSARATVDAALAWLATRDAARPFFLWLHLHDAHEPYAPPAPFAERFSTPYLAEVAAMDHELGRLLAALRTRALEQSTFVLALGDHGEAFGEHGETAHGLLCYETTLRIPLIARWPAGAGARRAGTRSRELVSAVDVAPTLAEALGLAPLAGLDGMSFFARALPGERGLYFESYQGYLTRGWSPIAGWLDARGKYLHSSAPELYDWRADPLERDDLVRAGEPQRYLHEIARLCAAPALAAQALGDGYAAEDLRALGYASSAEGIGPPPDPLAPNELPSPRTELAAPARR